jgi:hypothetical protein
MSTNKVDEDQTSEVNSDDGLNATQKRLKEIYQNMEMEQGLKNIFSLHTESHTKKYSHLISQKDGF